MFVIASDCVGGHLYHDLNKEHNHPFFWCVIPPNTMEVLLTNFDNIIHEYPMIDKSLHWNDWSTAKNTFDILLEDYRVHFIHNKLSQKDETIRKVGGDIYYKYAYKLTYENWKKRLARLPNHEPQFIITEHTGYGYTEKVLQRLAKITKYKLLILTNKSIIGNEYTTVIKISDYQITHYNNGRTQYILNEAKPKLKNWLIP